MAKIHGGSGKPQGSRNYGTHPRPSPVHGGSGLPKGQVRAPPPRLAVNSANYAGQVKRKG